MWESASGVTTEATEMVVELLQFVVCLHRRVVGSVGVHLQWCDRTLQVHSKSPALMQNCTPDAAAHFLLELVGDPSYRSCASEDRVGVLYRYLTAKLTRPVGVICRS